MYYICIENNEVVSVLNYVPNVPKSIEVVEISDSDHEKIQKETHFFNVETKCIQEVSKEVLDQKAEYVKNGEFRDFLCESDWKILRHIREKALGLETSLTEEEYLELEQARQQAADRIVKQ
jgi:hypothetical protein